MFTAIISTTDLSRNLNKPDWAVIDCRFSLDDTGRGMRDYAESHIPGALYAHLDCDLSGKKIPGKTGRHPLPDLHAFAETLSNWGIDETTQVVAYDDSSGAIAARLWWMMIWAGHRNVALLDGGWPAWLRAGLPTGAGAESRPARKFIARELPGAAVVSGQVEEYRNNPSYLLLDARSTARFRGDVEPIDTTAGHIPGAVSAPYEQNLSPDGLFLPPEILRRRYKGIFKSVPTENVICYCGSGVTAAHNIFAISYAGLGLCRLYAGSWSEWITDPSRPVAKGD